MIDDIEPFEDEEDEDFDFSIYDDDSEEPLDLAESLATLNKPTVTGLKSRFSNFGRELDRLANLEDDITKISIQVAARTQDISTLWEFYGMLSAFWERMRNIFGTIINEDVMRIKNRCRFLLNECRDRDNIPDKVHNNLLYLESVLCTLKQRVNLGLETEKSFRGIYSQAKRSITQ